MNHLLDDEEDDHRAGHPRDREITLGTTTVLGIFFGLAVLCAGFFGFGYSLGSKHVTTAVTPTGEPLSRSFGGSKPAPGSLAGSNPYAPVEPVNTTAPSTTVASSSGPAPKAVTPPAGAAAPPEAFETVEPAVKPPRTPPSAPTVTAAAPVVAAPLAAPVPAQQLVVQVAALSHQEDADLIRTTLERRGYVVAIRSDPNDKLLHVQVGPFGNRKDAEAMRQKLLSDGFNAYIK